MMETWCKMAGKNGDQVVFKNDNKVVSKETRAGDVADGPMVLIHVFEDVPLELSSDSSSDEQDSAMPQHGLHGQFPTTTTTTRTRKTRKTRQRGRWGRR